MSAHDVPWYRW